VVERGEPRMQQPAVFRRLRAIRLDPCPHARAFGIESAVRRRERRPRPFEFGAKPSERGHEHGAFVLEVAVERPVGEPGLFGDGTRGHGCVALAFHEPFECVEQSLAGPFGPPPRRPRRGGILGRDAEIGPTRADLFGLGIAIRLDTVAVCAVPHALDDFVRHGASSRVSSNAASWYSDFDVNEIYPLHETLDASTVIATVTLAPPAGAALPTPATRPARPDPPVVFVTATVMLGVIMAIIDTSIVNVALPNMAGNLGAAQDEIAWVATGYILANVVIMPLNGWLTALLGRKRFYAASLAIFTVASFLCGTAHDVWTLVFWRIVQGLGGGALQPTAQAILFESYPPEKRGGAMAIFGLGAMVGPAIGPTLGGAIVDNFSWPLIFYINLPIGVAALVMTFAFIRDPAYITKPERGADWIGLGAMTAGIASLQYVLEQGQREDWFSSQSIVILTVVSVAALAFFIARELRDPLPFVDLRVFGSRSFAAGTIIGIISGFGLYGLNLILPLFFQNVLGFDALQTGYALLPGAIATALSMPIAGRLTSVLDPRLEIAIGLGMFAAGSWWMGDLNQYAGFWDIFGPRTLQGFALGFLFVPLTTASLAEISNRAMSNATGLYTLVRQLGGSLGIALLELLQTRGEDVAQQALSAHVALGNPAVANALATAPNRTRELGSLAAIVGQNATVIAYDGIFRFCAIVFVCSIPTVMLLRKPKASGASSPIVVD
jgi:DHA2 family multidrug resistance protein